MQNTNVSSRLYALRWIEIACQILVLWFAQYWLALAPGQLRGMAAVVGGLALVNVFTAWRLRRPWPIADQEVFAQQCIDVLALGSLLYLSGGSTNPFVSLFLIPLTITAAILPPIYAWAMAALTLASYSLLLFVHVPLPAQRIELPLLASLAQAVAGSDLHVHAANGLKDGGFSLHILGMWFNFFVSAAIIAFFLARLAATLRARERELAAAREAALRNEQVLAVGTLAAGAAHQLGTPLSTMAVVIRELELEHMESPIQDSLGLLRLQVDNCKRLLSQLLSSAGQPRAEDSSPRALDRILHDLVEKWGLLRPRTVLTTDFQGEGPAPAIYADPSLEHALLNLLDNAADASPEEVTMTSRWDAAGCVIEILDRGPGLAGKTAQDLGRPFFTTKREQGGVGLGLFLSNATLERYGGKIELFDRPGGGACTRVTLPLARLKG
jgi:two-component system sensor histidine kinase RegB